MNLDALNQLPGPLLAWYDQNRRILPWREQPEPYRVWVSEIMLQQTRVEAVIDYFQRFMAALPTVEALANAPEEMLLKLWEGLGYYSRVRNLQKAAKIIMEQHQGQVPCSYKDILALPGVGQYTAGAICSIAFGLPVPAVDGNVLRVASRIAGDSSNTSLEKVKQAYREKIKEIIPPGAASQFNQGLMELGAIICLPNGAPKCLLCPACGFCAACRGGNPQDYPVKAAKQPRRTENRQVILLVSPFGVALRQRPAKGLLAGIWEFPNWLEEEVSPIGQLGCALGKKIALGKAKHIFTHIQWNMEGSLYLTEPFPLPAGWRWASRRELKEEIALPSAFRAYTKQLLAGDWI